MDVVYLAAAGIFWVLILGLAHGCARVQGRKVRS